LIRLANRHPRVDILQPGTGVGGHCIAVDPWFIVHAGGDDARMIRSGREVNNRKTEWVIEKIINEVNRFKDNNQCNPTVVCMGLAFKPNIDDLRESPAMHVFQQLEILGVQPLCIEPNLLKSSSFNSSNLHDASNNADIVVYLVAHKEFKGLTVKGIEMDFCGINEL
jgi:UDP-N-acetyl-D-mannosaminuronic acid dehydrogenase